MSVQGVTWLRSNLHHLGPCIASLQDSHSREGSPMHLCRLPEEVYACRQHEATSRDALQGSRTRIIEQVIIKVIDADEPCRCQEATKSPKSCIKSSRNQTITHPSTYPNGSADANTTGPSNSRTTPDGPCPLRTILPTTIRLLIHQRRTGSNSIT